ncbi:MAG: hypothetical protein ABF449_14665 [Ethanoligenens sp.]|uniref:hypothetical protein n=1 Tax=Ethanoligenens sp. TaxID=2099655 RepID=UPI0039E80702
MLETLKAYAEAQTIVSVYTNEQDTSEYDCGVLNVVDEEWAILNSVAPQGIYDGYRLLRTDDIYRIDAYGPYEDKIRYYARSWPEKHAVDFGTSPDVLHGFFNVCIQKGWLLSVELANSGERDVTGILKDYTWESVTLRGVDNYGHKDSLSTLLTERITNIDADSLYCRARLYAARPEDD